MPFFKINNHAYSPYRGGISSERIDVGSPWGNTANGISFRDNIKSKKKISITLKPMALSEVKAMMSFIDKIDCMSFDSTKTSQIGKVVPDSVGTNSLVTSPKKYGSKSLSLSSGSELSYNINLSNTYTISLWKHNGTTFDNWVYLSDGTQYKNGIEHTPSTEDIENFLSATPTSITIFGKSSAGVNSSTNYDDICIYKGHLSSSIISSIFFLTTLFVFSCSFHHS